MPLIHCHIRSNGGSKELVIDARELIKPLKEVERKTIESALILCGGNKKEASYRLGISYRTILLKISEYRREDGEY